MYALNTSLDRLDNEGEYERAATVALFNLQIRRAIQSLSKGASKVKGDCMKE